MHTPTFRLLGLSLFEEMFGSSRRLDTELGLDASELVEVDFVLLR